MRCLVLLTLLAGASWGHAQDMPLSEIIAPGEGWREARPNPDLILVSRTATSARLALQFELRVDQRAVFVRRGMGEERRVEVPLEKPAGLTLVHNDGTLVVGDAAGKHLWAFRVNPDGTLDAPERYCALRVRKEQPAAATTVLTRDRRDRIYAATREGIQIFDPTGRMCGVLTLPQGVTEVNGMAYSELDPTQLLIATPTKTYARTMIANAEPPAPPKKK